MKFSKKKLIFLKFFLFISRDRSCDRYSNTTFKIDKNKKYYEYVVVNLLPFGHV